MTDLLAEIRARDALKGHSPAGVTMTQAEADRRTLLRLLDATREELAAALGKIDRLNARPVAPTEWISPAGVSYDLTRPILDKDGEAWRHTGWFTNHDGEPEPRLTFAAATQASDRSITDIEGDYGPLAQPDQKRPDPAAEYGGDLNAPLCCCKRGLMCGACGSGSHWQCPDRDDWDDEADGGGEREDWISEDDDD